MARIRFAHLFLVLSVAASGCGSRTGVNPTTLSAEPGAELGPAFSPDGKSVAYEWNTGNGTGDIWVIDIETSQKRRLTYAPEARNGNPAWSPDGKEIAFESTRDGTSEIYLIDAAVGEGEAPGDRARKLTSDDGGKHNPSWSPDGKRIAYDCDSGGRPDVCVVDLDGSNVQVLTKSTSDDTHPSWSPDGTLIAFSSTRAGQKDIWKMNADGSLPRRLTTDREDEWDPAWTPDGRHVLYVREGEEGTRGFYEVYHDGRGVRQVLESRKRLRDPAVSPDGKRIAFSADPEGDPNLYLVEFETPNRDERSEP